MNIDYANAYRNERMTHAHLKRQQREAMLANKANKNKNLDTKVSAQ